MFTVEIAFPPTFTSNFNRLFYASFVSDYHFNSAQHITSLLQTDQRLHGVCVAGIVPHPSKEMRHRIVLMTNDCEMSKQAVEEAASQACVTMSYSMIESIDATYLSRGGKVITTTTSQLNNCHQFSNTMFCHLVIDAILWSTFHLTLRTEHCFLVEQAEHLTFALQNEVMTGLLPGITIISYAITPSVAPSSTYPLSITLSCTPTVVRCETYADYIATYGSTTSPLQSFALPNCHKCYVVPGSTCTSLPALTSAQKYDGAFHEDKSDEWKHVTHRRRRILEMFCLW